MAYLFAKPPSLVSGPSPCLTQRFFVCVCVKDYVGFDSDKPNGLLVYIKIAFL